MCNCGKGLFESGEVIFLYSHSIATPWTHRLRESVKQFSKQNIRNSSKDYSQQINTVKN
jgi:hypothetical protein